MSQFSISILGVSKMRWTEYGRLHSDNITVFYSRRQDATHTEGAGLHLDEKVTQALQEWEPVDSQIIRAHFVTNHAKVTINQCYTPTQIMMNR